MLPFVLGGVALAATGYGIKKFLTSESNLDKIDDALMKGIDWLDSVDQKAEIFFDGLIQKLDESRKKENMALLLDKLDHIKSITAIIIYNDLEEILFSATQNSCEENYQPQKIIRIKNEEQKSLTYTEENYLDIQRFCDILTVANAFLSQYIDEIKILPTQNKSSTELFKLSQKQIKKLYKLQTFLENVIYSPISIDNVIILNITIRSFNRIKHTIELFKS